MHDIRHLVGVRAAPEDVYRALATIDGLAGWWTEQTSGSAEAGGTIDFRFPNGAFAMKVVDQVPGRSVRWTVIDGPEEWVGTEIRWDLRQEDDFTKLVFTHAGWREPVEFMHHCSTKWAVYILSLKQLVETGTGAPSPHDPKIDSWD